MRRRTLLARDCRRNARRAGCPRSQTGREASTSRLPAAGSGHRPAPPRTGHGVRPPAAWTATGVPARLSRHGGGRPAPRGFRPDPRGAEPRFARLGGSGAGPGGPRESGGHPGPCEQEGVARTGTRHTHTASTRHACRRQPRSSTLARRSSPGDPGQLRPPRPVHRGRGNLGGPPHEPLPRCPGRHHT